MSIFSGFSAAALAVSTGALGLWPSLALGVVVGCLVAWRGHIEPLPTLPPDPADDWMRWVPALVLSLFMVVATYTVTPGADAAMYGGIARALLDRSPDLSAAYPHVRVAMYPRGFSLLIAAMSPALGMAKATLVAAFLSYVAYAVALATWLRLFVPLRFAYGFAVALMFVSRHVPFGLFGWGSNPTALAFALGLYASVLSARRGSWFYASLIMAGAFSTHPLGALSGCAAMPLVFMAERKWRVLVPLAVVAPILLAFKLHGPAVSEFEREWIAQWQASSAHVLKAKLGIVPLDYLSAMSRELGDWLAIFAYAAAAMVVWRWRQHLSSLAIAGVGLVYIALLMLVGPRLPVVGSFIYQDRLTLMWIVALAPLLATAAHHMLRFEMRTWAPVFGLVATLALSTIAHLGWHSDPPLATADDLAIADCVRQKVPAGEVIVARYGQGGQWLAALTGHPITQAHVHCSLFDEMHTQREQMRSRYQFLSTGPVVYPSPEIPVYEAEATLCETGSAKLVRLKDAVLAGPDPW